MATLLVNFIHHKSLAKPKTLGTPVRNTKANAAFLLDHLRGRWHLENRGFHALDVSLGDDASRTRTGHAARALHAIRSMALNLARRFDQSTPSLCREHALKPNLLMNRLRIFKN